MAPKAPLRSLSLFLLDRRIERWEEALRSTGGLHEHRLKSDSGVDGVLYLRPQGRKAPNWVGFVEPHVEDEGSLRSLFNASTSAVLFLTAGGRRFAIVFGQGRHLLDPDSFEYDFGLRVVLNAVEPERLKSIDAKRFDERSSGFESASPSTRRSLSSLKPCPRPTCRCPTRPRRSLRTTTTSLLPKRLALFALTLSSYMSPAATRSSFATFSPLIAASFMSSAVELLLL
ncbi:MAG: TIGR04141 family sporadically distributed protein [Thermoleophilia bacterium]|nr:TIGR04141 family sporadically distributed protein [Thermoleophilia bacterium]